MCEATVTAGPTTPDKSASDGYIASGHGRIYAPVATPFNEDGGVDTRRLTEHCRRLLTNGCDGLALFGTTSEAASLSITERMTTLEAVLEASVPPHQLMVGTGCCAIPDTVQLTRHAVARGCADILMLPPFFYKDVDHHGIAQAFIDVVERVADDRLRVYLYHIPQVTHVSITPELVTRLRATHRGSFVGVKDSSGDWPTTSRFLEELGPDGFDVFVGSEIFLSRALAAGGRGCITATANVNPHGISAVIDDTVDKKTVTARQEAATRVRQALQDTSLIPAVKEILARWFDPGWRRIRPPLSPLDRLAADRLISEAHEAGLQPLDQLT